MNEQNYENNYETMEATVEFEPMVVEEAEPQRNDLMIGVGIGAAAAIVVEHVLVPLCKKAYKKIKARKDPKFHVVDGAEAVVVDEDDIED